jgi:hypothetical protein
MDAERRLKRVEEQIFSLLPDWNFRPVVDGLEGDPGIALINAVVLVTEAGDFTRFSDPRQLMAYFGLVPGERSSGETVRRGTITKTKTGNTHARRALVKGAWGLPNDGAHRPSQDPMRPLLEDQFAERRRRRPDQAGVGADALDCPASVTPVAVGHAFRNGRVLAVAAHAHVRGDPLYTI